MGADTVTIDYNTDISWEQALDAERRANEYIYADVPIEINYPSREELTSIDYRSKKELTGQVRIVRFPDADCCACCGTHGFHVDVGDVVLLIIGLHQLVGPMPHFTGPAIDERVVKGGHMISPARREREVSFF